MYLIVVNGKQHSCYSSNEYVEAMEEAAQLDHMHNSPELNDGIQGTTVIKLLTVMSDADLDHRAAMAD